MRRLICYTNECAIINAGHKCKAQSFLILLQYLSVCASSFGNNYFGMCTQRQHWHTQLQSSQTSKSILLFLKQGKELIPLICSSKILCSTLTSGFITTTIGLLVKCHSSLMNLMPGIGKNCCTMYNGTSVPRLLNFLSMLMVVLLWTTIGTHTTLPRLPSSLRSSLRVETSLSEMSGPEMNNNTYLCFNTSK